MGKFDYVLYFFDCEDAFAIGGGFECIELLQVWVETDELVLVFAYLLNAEGVAGPFDYLLLFE